MSRKCALAIALLCAGPLYAIEPRLAELGEDYCLPLAGRYAVYYGGPYDPAHELVELHSAPGAASLSFSKILPNVKQIAVVGTVITGKTPEGFFVLDTKRPI